jgi:hypothetical protein
MKPLKESDPVVLHFSVVFFAVALTHDVLAGTLMVAGQPA